MNKAQTLTNLSIVAGLLGVVALVLEWMAAFGNIQAPPGFWFDTAKVLLLIAIWLKLGAMYHKGTL